MSKGRNQCRASRGTRGCQAGKASGLSRFASAQVKPRRFPSTVDRPGTGSRIARRGTGCSCRMRIRVRQPPRLRSSAGSASFGARARPGCPTAWRTDPARPACRPSGAARRPGRTHQLATIDRVPRSYAVGHRHQGAPVCAIPPSVSTNRRPCAARPTHRPEIQRSDAEPLAIGHRGPSSRRHENGWLSGSLTAGLQDVQSISTLPGTREASSWSSSRHQAIHPYRVLWLYKHSALQGCSPTGWCSRRQAQDLHRSRPTSRSETGIIGKAFSIRYSCRNAQGAPHNAGAPVVGGSRSRFCAFWHSLPSTLP